MKKKGIFILLICGLIISILVVINKERDVIYNPGIYVGKGVGHEGPIVVEVEVNVYEIEEINIKEEYEMPEISSHVYQDIIDKVKKSNNTEIDDISGATYTSKGLIEAIKDAMMKAKVSK